LHEIAGMLKEATASTASAVDHLMTRSAPFIAHRQ
jgi:hypothetical protein